MISKKKHFRGSYKGGKKVSVKALVKLGFSCVEVHVEYGKTRRVQE